MLTIKELSARAVKQLEVTWPSNQPVRIEAMQGTQITQSRVSDMATTIHSHTPGSFYTSNASVQPQNNVVLNDGRGNELARISKWGSIDSILQALDLEKDVFKIPIETLLNLWVTRFGNEWVDLEAVIDNDEFFLHAYKRLKQMGLLEQHYLTDRARYVCRKPE